MNTQDPELSIILPCLNEEKSLPKCLEQIKEVLARHNLNTEIIVVDNASTDNTPQIAKSHNVRLVYEPVRGYGSAYLAGFNEAKGNFLFLADSDGTYDFGEIPNFLKYLHEGYDFVIGDRFKGKMYKNSMPWAHRYIGNPILSFLSRLIYKAKIHDVHCGMRAISRTALDKLKLKTTGMEFASEMVIVAEKKNLKTMELPINYHPRIGHSKLKSVPDGWRHLRFMLLYSPLYLFFLPGLFMLLTGAVTFYLLYFDSVRILDIQLYHHPMFFSALLIITGYQLIIFALFSKTYAITHLGDKPVLDGFYRHCTIEKSSIVGIIVGATGAIIYGIIFLKWVKSGFGELNEIKNSILALILITIGIQTIFSSFMVSILGIKEK